MHQKAGKHKYWRLIYMNQDAAQYFNKRTNKDETKSNSSKIVQKFNYSFAQQSMFKRILGQRVLILSVMPNNS